MRKGAASMPTLPSTDFCLVNGGPIVQASFPSQIYFSFLVEDCLVRLEIGQILTVSHSVLSAADQAYIFSSNTISSLYYSCSFCIIQNWNIHSYWYTFWKLVELGLGGGLTGDSGHRIAILIHSSIIRFIPVLFCFAYTPRGEEQLRSDETDDPHSMWCSHVYSVNDGMWGGSIASHNIICWTLPAGSKGMAGAWFHKYNMFEV